MSEVSTVLLLSVATVCARMAAERFDKDSEEAVGLRDLADDVSKWLTWAAGNNIDRALAALKENASSSPAVKRKREKPYRLQNKLTRADVDPCANYGRV